MIFGDLPLDEAEGAMLAHAIVLGGRRVPKGAAVDAALLAAARAEGLATLWIARAEPGDIGEEEAARAIGAALAGPGLCARAPVHGRVNLHAARDGLLRFDTGTVAAANGQTEEIGIATLPPLTPVRSGDLVATIKIIPFAVAGAAVAAVRAAGAVIEVAPWIAGQDVVLVQTARPDTPEKMMAKTAGVTRDRLARFGWPLREAGPVPHVVAPLARALQDLRPACDLILGAGATATADRRDVIPAALEAAGGTVERVGMPVDPGNLLVLGGFDAGPVVIGLPGCARSPKRNGLDLVLERFAAGLPLGAASLDEMGVGGLLEESGAAVPWAWTG
jgi:molybdenum cofactor cytidylyltransferase